MNPWPDWWWQVLGWMYVADAVFSLVGLALVVVNGGEWRRTPDGPFSKRFNNLFASALLAALIMRWVTLP